MYGNQNVKAIILVSVLCEPELNKALHILTDMTIRFLLWSDKSGVQLKSLTLAYFSDHMLPSELLPSGITLGVVPFNGSDVVIGNGESVLGTRRAVVVLTSSEPDSCVEAVEILDSVITLDAGLCALDNVITSHINIVNIVILLSKYDNVDLRYISCIYIGYCNIVIYFQIENRNKRDHVDRRSRM